MKIEAGQDQKKKEVKMRYFKNIVQAIQAFEKESNFLNSLVF